MRQITSIALEITTACNLHCPNCCSGMGHRPAVHHPWSYFVETLASWIYGMERVDVTGGEPTCHPQFELFSSRFRELFGCRRLTLETNGFKAREYETTLRLYDFIRTSRYPENGEVVDWITANFPGYTQNGSTCVELEAEPDERRHVSLSRRGGGQPCLLGKFEFVLYADGKFWPCRLGPAVPGAVGIEPCEGWIEKVLALPMPCRDCYFSTWRKMK